MLRIRSYRNMSVPHDTPDTSGRKYLIPVVTATWPRRLNQPQIHEAKGALLGVESIAAQKYGPPLVGWALQISEKG